jgi:hypothetical protein
MRLLAHGGNYEFSHMGEDGEDGGDGGDGEVFTSDF